MAIKNGHNLRIYIDGTAIAKATNCQYQISVDEIETAHKDTAGNGTGWLEIEPGQKSITLSSEGILAEEDASIDTLFDAIANNTEISFTFSDEVSGNRFWSVDGYCLGLEVNAPNNENVTYSASFKGNGAPSRGLVA